MYAEHSYIRSKNEGSSSKEPQQGQWSSPNFTSTCKVVLGVAACIFLSVGKLISAIPTKLTVVAPVTVAAPEPVKVTDPWQGYRVLKQIAACETTGDPNGEPVQFLPDGHILRGSPIRGPWSGTDQRDSLGTQRETAEIQPVHL